MIVLKQTRENIMSTLKLGTCLEIKTMGHGLKQASIKLDDGTFTIMFEEFKGYNKSIKVGDRVKVRYEYSNFMDCLMVRRITRIKPQDAARLQVLGNEIAQDNDLKELFNKSHLSLVG